MADMRFRAGLTRRDAVNAKHPRLHESSYYALLLILRVRAARPERKLDGVPEQRQVGEHPVCWEREVWEH
jgi:hypothetical protein